MNSYTPRISNIMSNLTKNKFNPLSRTFIPTSTLQISSDLPNPIKIVDEKYRVNYYLRNLDKNVFYDFILPGLNCLYKDEIIEQINFFIKRMNWSKTDILIAIPIDKKALVMFYDQDLKLYDFEDNHETFCKRLMFDTFTPLNKLDS